jgi:fermentation-respiration switch protein FrsA (DUF1100 family)
MRTPLTLLALALSLTFAAPGRALAAGGYPGCGHRDEDVCRATPPAGSPYFVDESRLPFAALPGTATTRHWGVERGAGYQIEVPENWNGGLLVWNHGFRNRSILELTVEPPRIRQWLIEHGYAWAASSYSANGYDVVPATCDTHRLNRLFEQKVGRPRRIYIAGESMGGHVAGLAIERWPRDYAGALPSCGVMGDYELHDFYLDLSLTSQQLGGVSAVYPPDPATYAASTIPAVKARLERAPGSWPFALSAEGTSFKNVVEQRSGGERPLFDQAFLFWNTIAPGDPVLAIGASDGRIPPNLDKRSVGNRDTVYQFDGDPALTEAEKALNDGVLRVDSERGARARTAIVSGRIEMPVLTLHTIGDLFVPFSMEQIYAARVAEQRKSHLLVQRAIRDVQHCGFTPAELERGFSDLVDWVETGVRPAGDDVLDPATVADPDFGCAHTLSDRSYPAPISLPACP